MSRQHNIPINPHVITAHLAAGAAPDFLRDAHRKIKDDLGKLGYDDPLQRKRLPHLTSADLLPLVELNKIYSRARAVTNGVLAGGTLLPSMLDAASLVMAKKNWDDFPGELDEYSAALKDSRLTQHPLSYQHAQVKLAKIMLGPRNSATAALSPELQELMLDARKLQMLAWAQMRIIINDVVSEEEITQMRKGSSNNASMETILKRVEDSFGIARIPSRIMQHDHWRHTLEQLSVDELGRSENELMRNTMKSLIDNSHTVSRHLVAHMVARIRNGSSPDEALRQVITLDTVTIAANTRRVSHDEPFNDRTKPHPNFSHDFSLLVRGIIENRNRAVIEPDEAISWLESDSTRRGGCPAQSMIKHKSAAQPLAGSNADKAEETINQLRQYSQKQFGVQPKFSDPATVAELFVTVNLLAMAKPKGPLREGSEFFTHVIAPLINKELPGPWKNRTVADQQTPRCPFH